MRPGAGNRKGDKHKMKEKSNLKTWQITVERSAGTTDTYFIQAGTLYEAFLAFSEAFFPWNMIGLHITEAKSDEKQEERKRPGADLP